MFKLKEKQAAMLSAAKEFISGTPIQLVMEKYNVSYASVYNTIKRNNLEYRYPGNRRIQFNTRYFMTLDDEHKAYWIGFLFADGSIQRTDKKVLQPNRLSLSVNEQDVSVIEKFADDIDMSHDNIRHYYARQGYKPGNFACVYCNSVDMVNDLISHGFTLLKKDRSILPCLPKELQNHFVRGYFDGDGSISSSEFNITSEGNIVPLIYEILVKECSLSRTKISYTKNSYRIRWGGRDSMEKIGTYLYENATVYLERKFVKFCDSCFRN